MSHTELLKEFLRQSNINTKGYKYILVYFYPRDNTPGCTTEAKEFSQLKEQFEKLDTLLIGVSKNSEESHKKFIEKHNLTIHLLSDPEAKLLKAFNVLKKKTVGGRTYLTVDRSSFLLKLPELDMIKSWHSVKPQGHAAEVLEYVKTLNNHKELPEYTRDEVATHNSERDCWIIIENKVYDVTELLSSHSGGKDAIVPHCGKDATSVFIGKPHSDQAKKKLKKYLKGVLKK